MRWKKSEQYKHKPRLDWAHQNFPSLDCPQLQELKKKCGFWRKKTGKKQYQPYECFVRAYGIGPFKNSGLRDSTIARKLSMTDNKVHQSKWIACYLLGVETDGQGYSHSQRIAREIGKSWADREEEKEPQPEPKPKPKPEPEPESKPEPEAKKLSIEEEIIDNGQWHMLLLEEEISRTNEIIQWLKQELQRYKKKRTQWIESLEREQKKRKLIQKTLTKLGL